MHQDESDPVYKDGNEFVLAYKVKNDPMYQNKNDPSCQELMSYLLFILMLIARTIDSYP